MSTEQAAERRAPDDVPDDCSYCRLLASVPRHDATVEVVREYAGGDLP